MVKSLNCLKDEFLRIVAKAHDSGSCSMGYGFLVMVRESFGI